jgi:hypothetical protein
MYTSDIVAQPSVVAVTTFGAIPNSKQDATIALQKAIAYCKAHQIKRLVFPKGQYDFYATSAIQKEYFISNTSSETECPSKIKNVGLLFEGINHLTIEGNGSLFVFHGKMISFALDHCNDITLQNISVDYERPTMSEFRIEQSTDNMVEVSVHPQSWYKIKDRKIIWYGEGWENKYYHCIRIDTTNETMYYANSSYGKLMAAKVREVAPLKLRFEGELSKTDFPVGNVFTVRDPIRDQVGAFIGYSKNIHVKKVNMRYMHGLGIVSQFTENITMEHVTIAPPENSGRYIASSADGMHFSGCSGNVVVDHCTFNGMHDDPINVHGTHLKIIQQNASNQITVQFMHHQTYGMEAFFTKDTIAFVGANTLLKKGYGIVQQAQKINDREVLLTFVEPITTNIQVGDVVENSTRTPNFYLRNCTFKQSNTRGLLVTTGRKVVIENNVFHRLGMHAILIANDAQSWYESGAVNDVLIRNNTFNECGYNSAPDNYVIAIVPENHEEQAGKYVHRNIRLVNNTFNVYDAPLLMAKSVDKLTFSNNTIQQTSLFSTNKQLTPSFNLHGTNGVEIMQNKFNITWKPTVQLVNTAVKRMQQEVGVKKGL